MDKKKVNKVIQKKKKIIIRSKRLNTIKKHILWTKQASFLQHTEMKISSKQLRIEENIITLKIMIKSDYQFMLLFLFVQQYYVSFIS
jgi:hypothetical protein